MATLILKFNLPDEVKDQLRALPAPLKAKIEEAARVRGLDGLGFFIMMKTMLLIPKENITLDPIEQDILAEVWLNLKAFEEGALGQNGKRLDEIAGSQSSREESGLREVGGAEDVAVEVDDKNVARLVGTRIKIAQIAQEQTRLGLTPEQIQAHHPHLSLGQVYVALAYYYDHRDVVEAQIAASLARADQAREEAGTSPLAARLRAQGRLPAERAA